MSTQLVIADATIRQTEEGLYCLNDLHKSAGGENKHRPSLFIGNQQTQRLIAQIEKAGNPAIQSKQQLGTFVAKPIVYAYAMWISPEFHLSVIEAYDAMVQTGSVAYANELVYTKNKLIESLENNSQLQSQHIANLEKNIAALQARNNDLDNLVADLVDLREETKREVKRAIRAQRKATLEEEHEIGMYYLANNRSLHLTVVHFHRSEAVIKRILKGQNIL